MLQRPRNVLEVTAETCYNVSETSWKLPQEEVTTYQNNLGPYIQKMLQRLRNVLELTILLPQEPLGSYCAKMLQRMRNVSEAHTRRCYSVSETSWNLHQENLTTYQARLASYRQKMLQQRRNVLQFAARRVTTYETRLSSYCKKMFQSIRKDMQLTPGKWYNLSQPPWKLPHENVLTHQERLGIITRRFCNVSGTSWKLPCARIWEVSCNLHQEHVATYQECLGS